MNNTWTKLAAAAVIALVAIIGIARLAGPTPGTEPTIAPVAQQTLAGPQTHAFADGSTVTLAEGASIRTYAEAGRRGFEHLAGVIDVTVAKGRGEFIVTTAYGDVKALGTEFQMELIDGVTTDTKEPVQLLTVEVTEGKVEVSNSKGAETLEAMQNVTVAMDSAPYDFNQDESLPMELRKRIQAMIDAFAAGDPAAWAANFNLNYIFKLIKGQVEYDSALFGGSEDDARRLQEAFKDVKDVTELSQLFLGSINIAEPIDVYVRSVELNEAGDHARAQCVRRKGAREIVMTRPQWHDFDDGWWQIDD